MKKMKKIALALTLALALSVLAVPVSAYAASEPDTQVQETVKTPTKQEMKRLCIMVDSANAAIAVAVKMAQLTPYDDVDILVKSTESIAKVVFDYAEKIGATVECDYTEYIVDGKKVLIDPIRVINIGDEIGDDNDTAA